MAETPSVMIPLGTKAPFFELLDTRSKKTVSLNDMKSDIATVVMFICNHCPYVKLIQPKLLEITKQYQQQNISFIAINSNDAAHYPADSPDKMHDEAIQKEFTFPYLFDESQQVAHAYQAACTPDFYVFDRDLKCVYRGRFDNATPGNGKMVTGKDLCGALDSVLRGEAVSEDQRASLGCNIKWKK